MRINVFDSLACLRISDTAHVGDILHTLNFKLAKYAFYFVFIKKKSFISSKPIFRSY